MGTIIFIVVVGLIILLGGYTLAERRKIESQKKFMKNMNNYGNSGRSENDPVSRWNKHKRGK